VSTVTTYDDLKQMVMIRDISMATMITVCTLALSGVFDICMIRDRQNVD